MKAQMDGKHNQNIINSISEHERILDLGDAIDAAKASRFVNFTTPTERRKYQRYKVKNLKGIIIKNEEEPENP
jgi:hypothetical protein